MTGTIGRWLLASAVLAHHGVALAQNPPPGYPSRPVRIIVSVAPGAGADAMARAAAQMLSDKWGKNAVVDNRPGGGGVIATELVASAAPDGYTILSHGETLLLQGAQKRITFDVLKILGLNGVFVFTGIPTHKPAIPVTADSLMRDMVLKNQVIVGTVSADRTAFENAIRDLGVFKKRWPKALNSVISGRFPMDAYRDLLLGKATGIKNVITIGN